MPLSKQARKNDRARGHLRFANNCARECMDSNCFTVVVMQISTSESVELSKFPEEPKTLTRMSFPGHFSFSIRSSFATSLARLSSLSSDGSNRSYSSRMSPLSLSCSAGCSAFLGCLVGGPSSSLPPSTYGIRRFLYSLPDSYLHTKGVARVAG